MPLSLPAFSAWSVGNFCNLNWDCGSSEEIQLRLLHFLELSGPLQQIAWLSIELAHQLALILLTELYLNDSVCHILGAWGEGDLEALLLNMFDSHCICSIGVVFICVFAECFKHVSWRAVEDKLVLIVESPILAFLFHKDQVVHLLASVLAFRCWRSGSCLHSLFG